MPSTDYTLSRRRALATGGGAVLCSLGGCVGSVLSRLRRDYDRDAPVGDADGPWPTYQHDVRSSGYAPGAAGPGGDATVEHVLAGPAAFGTSVAVGSAGDGSDPGTEFGSGVVGLGGGDGEEGAYYALSPAGGSSWRSEYVHGKSTPTVAGDAVFVSTAEFVAAYDRTTGEHCWSTREGGVGTVDNAPLLAAGTLVDHAGGAVYGRNPRTGERRWCHDTDRGAPTAAVADDGTVYAVVADRPERTSGTPGEGSATATRTTGDEPTPDGEADADAEHGLAALDAATGEVRWRRFGLPESSSALATDGERVYYGMRGGLSALSTADGSTAWTGRLPNGDAASGLAVTDERVHVQGSDSLAALAAGSGETVWERRDVATNYRVPPVVAGGTRFGVGNGRVRALDPATGERRWAIATGVRPRGPLSVAGGRLYFTGEGERSGVFRLG